MKNGPAAMKKCPKIKDKPGPVLPPSWLSRGDKVSFLAEIDRRYAGNCHLTPDEIDTLADYISARSRLAVLNRLWRKTLASNFRRDEEVLKLSRQIDAATASARRLAKALAMPGGKPGAKAGPGFGARAVRSSQKPMANGPGLFP